MQSDAKVRYYSVYTSASMCFVQHESTETAATVALWGPLRSTLLAVRTTG